MSLQNTAGARSVSTESPAGDGKSRKVQINIDDPTSWTADFSKRMRDSFKGIGVSTLYSSWERRRLELLKYEEAMRGGTVSIGHPLAKNNCKGPRAGLITPLTEKERKVALNFRDAF